MAGSSPKSNGAPTESSLAQAVERDPQRMSGVPLFRGTRVPVRALFDYLRAGKSSATFLDDFEGVGADQVEAVLAAAEADVFRDLESA